MSVLKRKKRENKLKKREVRLRVATDGNITGGMDVGRGEKRNKCGHGWLRD